MRWYFSVQTLGHDLELLKILVHAFVYVLCLSHLLNSKCLCFSCFLVEETFRFLHWSSSVGLVISTSSANFHDFDPLIKTFCLGLIEMCAQKISGLGKKSLKISTFKCWFYSEQFLRVISRFLTILLTFKNMFRLIFSRRFRWLTQTHCLITSRPAEY